ncbi:uncharacterized protein JCM6883_005243 [Sporobolomyces salmoneus]|uniref:uncharacterized protein n=1 Tax=Sporobolomyces salmoneus TaxID=183962 RepID=UPI0031724DE9
MSSATLGYSLVGKDAAAKEREDRLLAAKKKLKLYRARTSQRMSNASAATESPRKDSRRQSIVHTVGGGSISSVHHQHRRSLSKASILAGEGAKVGGAHGKRLSRSRLSRGSISGFAGLSNGKVGGGGHGHTRSRASISISMSNPNSQPTEESTPTLRSSTALPAPSSWQQPQNAFPSSSSEPSRPLSTQLSNVPLRSTSPLPPPPAPGPRPPQQHGRHGSRHTRRSSVSNFRESLEIVSGANLPLPASLHSTVSSFSAPATTHGGGSVSPSSAASRSPLPPPPPSLPVWSSDPRQVLEALKERGRIEDEDDMMSPEQTRQSALEALEGRVSAPSPVISLGTEQPGELLSAPPPASGTALSPLPPTMNGFSSSTSPMIGLGVGMGMNGKRSSWGTQAGSGAGLVTIAGGQGAMELGGIEEEDEEEEEERRTSTPVSSPKRIISSASPRKRTESNRSKKDEAAPAPPRRSSIRPLSLSMSSSFSADGPPPTSPFGLRVPSGPPSPVDERTAHSPGEKRHISVFHSVAASQLGNGLPTSPLPSNGSPQQRGGLRSLSIGTNASNSTASLLDRRFPSRPASVAYGNTSMQPTPRRSSPLPPPPATLKRSSISYRTDPSTPESQKRTSRSSVALVSPTVSTSTYSSFPFGVTGGFGDLEVDEELDQESRPTSFAHHDGVDNTSALEAEIVSLRSQFERTELRCSDLESTHALEISEFEKKASLEANELRSRISELERLLDDERNARRLELEGLERAASMAKEAMADLTDERDSLREDVDGWRTRCNKLETTLKKGREDEALAEAQGKLIGEMRDQIYTLVAALERERGEHGETRKEVERMLEERMRGVTNAVAEVQSSPQQPQLQQSKPPQTISSQQPQRSDSVALDMGMIYEDDDDDDEESSLGHYHQSKTTSDASMLSGSSFRHSFSGNTTEDTSLGTDLEDSYSNKIGSPRSNHSSVNSLPSTFGSAPNSVRGRDSDVVAALGQLDTLAEEDEEDEEAALGGNSLSHEDRIRLDSAGSQLSTSTGSDVMPRTPDKASSEHNRSHSFIRHWSFPKGSICSSRVSYEEEDSSFFGYNKHDSLPPLPISENILPPFLTASLDVDEDTFNFFPHQSRDSTSSHARRPSFPRPLDRMNPHARRFSGQYAMKAPPVSPSALVTVALSNQQQQQPRAPIRSSNASISSSASVPTGKSLSRLSFGALIGSLGGWSPANSESASSLPAPATAKLGLANAPLLEEAEEEEEEEEDDDEEGQEEDVFITTTAHGTPRQLQHQNQRPMRYIKPTEVPRPIAARLGLLNFVGSACCSERPVFVV